jgi:hypothetical protein
MIPSQFKIRSVPTPRNMFGPLGRGQLSDLRRWISSHLNHFAYYLEMTYEVRNEHIYKIRKVRVVCIGAGLTGIAAVHKLQSKHVDLDIDFQIYEKNHEVGGTWLENKYPGCACDVPAHSVCFCMTLLTVVYIFMGRKRRLESILRWVQRNFCILQGSRR